MPFIASLVGFSQENEKQRITGVRMVNIEEQIRYQSNFWVQVLERIVNITLVLCKNSLAFRGHRESFDNEYNGKFLTQVQLLAKYDNVMKQVLSMLNGSIKYLSHQIQNEVILCLATHLKATLTADINSSPFYSIIMDTTQDITKRDQLSQVFRYVKIIKNEQDEATSIEIKEVFLGFTEIYNHTAAGLHEEILNLLEKHHIKLSNCRGQGYDGANVMSGIYNGVQALFKKNQPNAMYMHCAAHNLNLVINDAVKCCVSFFVMLEDVYSFFGNSMNRWDLRSKYTGESQITLKRLNPTRWAGRYTSLFAVKIRFHDIMKALSEISITSTKREEREEAVRIQKNMSSFEFVFLCVLLSKIFNEVHIPSKLLQTKNLDLTTASGSLENASKNLKQYRKMFDSAKLEAVEIATTWQIPAIFFQKRRKIVKRHFDELSTDHRFDSSEEIFRINIFIKFWTSLSTNSTIDLKECKKWYNYFPASIQIN
ncbi:zinc finger MYM-type protein 1-like [Hydra vulgaris]|uniref:Zinc finger MYM-type protein 1-like n=1 Tax=Hydra vulgaris TaxID=6087 RepID=A0ABM4CMD9_HYDVU